jgi:hypothetical protein
MHQHCGLGKVGVSYANCQNLAMVVANLGR